jgi:hypothetical protein
MRKEVGREPDRVEQRRQAAGVCGRKSFDGMGSATVSDTDQRGLQSVKREYRKIFVWHSRRLRQQFQKVSHLLAEVRRD